MNLTRSVFIEWLADFAASGCVGWLRVVIVIVIFDTLSYYYIVIEGCRM